MVYLAGNHWHSFGCSGSVSSKATLNRGSSYFGQFFSPIFKDVEHFKRLAGICRGLYYGKISKPLQCFGRINWKSRRSSVRTRVMFSRSAIATISVSTKSSWRQNTAGESLRNASNLLDEGHRELVRWPQGSRRNPRRLRY